MSLPAGQQRVIDNMEGVLRASEPQLASMFAIFARLNEGELVRAEPLEIRRRRWLQPGNAMYAIVLVPVMFVAIIVGALLGGSARATGTCEASYSVGGASVPVSRASCPITGKAAGGKPAGGPAASGTPNASCAAAPSQAGPVPASPITTVTGGDQAFSPPARAYTTTANGSGVCYK